MSSRNGSRRSPGGWLRLLLAGVVQLTQELAREMAAITADLNRALARQGLEPVEVLSREAWEERSEAGGN